MSRRPKGNDLLFEKARQLKERRKALIVDDPIVRRSKGNDVLFEKTCQPKERQKALIIDDPIVTKLLLVWEQVTREYLTDADDNDHWGGCFFSFSEWCRLACVPDSLLNTEKCEMLMRLYIVLPDGRLHYWVNEALDLLASKILGIPDKDKDA